VQHVYFASDTENTREAATAPNNGIWKSSRDGAKRAATPLIHVALFELDCALGGATTGEPPNTLAHNIKCALKLDVPNTPTLYIIHFCSFCAFGISEFQSKALILTLPSLGVCIMTPVNITIYGISPFLGHIDRRLRPNMDATDNIEIIFLITL
jgi:hypothetical protein